MRPVSEKYKAAAMRPTANFMKPPRFGADIVAEAADESNRQSRKFCNVCSGVPV